MPLCSIKSDLFNEASVSPNTQFLSLSSVPGLKNDSPYAHKPRSSISGLAAEISKDKDYTLHQKNNFNRFKSQVQAILLVYGLLAPISQRTVPRQKIFCIVTPGHHIQFFRPFESGHLSLQFCRTSEVTQRLQMHNSWSNLPVSI